jgi:galactonate dehydratase
MADLAALYRVAICLHNVSGLILNMASQQFSAAIFNCPLMECSIRADQYQWATQNPIVIKDGKMKVSTAPGLGLDLDHDYLKAHRADGEPWWG